jgi:hypothetical protein
MEDAEAIWTAKTDDELLEASRELFEYTEEGERIIRAELQRRRLPAPEPPIGKCARCGRSIASNDPGDQCAQCGEPFSPDIVRKLGADAPEPALVSVLRTQDPGVVPLAISMLDNEGIEHLVRGAGLQDIFGGDSFGGYGTGAGEIWVREDDAPRARVLLAGLTSPEADTDPDVGAAPPPRERSVRDQLIGHWTLESLAAVNGSEIEYPMGQDIEGVLTYDAADHMATQIMRHGRPGFVSGDMDGGTPAELSAALTGYTAYFGTYSVDDAASSVTHYVKGSLLPNWVGTEQVREIVFDGDRLTLTSPPILFRGQKRLFRAIWRRG